MTAMTIPRPHTTLSSYADKMGINPMHFFGGVTQGLFNLSSSCGTVWQRHTWQNDDNVSHEDLAYQLMNAERDIFALFNYPVHPQWVALDIPYPKPRNGMYNKYGGYKTLSLNVGYVHAAGVRKSVKVADALDVIYTDEDGDGYKETATIDISLLDQTEWFDNYGKILVVATDYGEEFAIDSYLSIDANKIVARGWVMIDPEIASAFPKDDRVIIDLGKDENLIQQVDLYRVYNDPTGAVLFDWGNGTTQPGTAEILDVGAGIVRPIPDGTTGWCTGTAPSRVKLSVYTGYVADDYWNVTADEEHAKLDPLFAETIRLLATARLERDLCGCGNVLALGKDLREDMALVSPQGNFLAVADVIQECPFGTRRGEWLAFNKVKNFQDKYVSVALV